MNKIDPDVFTFYKELTKNNNRNWFEHQKERFKKLELGVKKFAENIKLGLDTADDIEKVKLFRIYRDVRFSKDKTPYKTHFGIAFHRKKPELRGGYYIHISPNNSFIASGFWDPSPSDLLRIRKEIVSFNKILQVALALIGLWGTKFNFTRTHRVYNV